MKHGREHGGVNKSALAGAELDGSHIGLVKQLARYLRLTVIGALSWSLYLVQEGARRARIDSETDPPHSTRQRRECKIERRVAKTSELATDHEFWAADARRSPRGG